MKNGRNKGSKKGYEEKGFIMLVAVIVMTFLLLLVAPFLYQLSTENRNTNKSSTSFAALSLAEAGVERAIWELNYGDVSGWEGDSSMRTMTISDFESANGNVLGNIAITIQNPDGTNPVIEATGIVAGSGSEQLMRTTRVVLKRDTPPPVFDYGVFGDEGLDLNSNAFIDSYDSRTGAYGGSNVGFNGNVGTNAVNYGCISLDSNARIYGDAFTGPESQPDNIIITRSNSLITGKKGALSEAKGLTPISVPEGLQFMGDYNLGGNSQDTISQSGEYTSFRLTSNAKVTIAADVTLYITGDFSMQSNTRLEIAEGVTVRLYLGGTFLQSSNTQINNLSKDPTKFVILGTETFDGQMQWNSNSQFWGSIYVPRANVNFNSNADFYGSIVARSVNSIASNARIHYDEALSGLDIGAPDDDCPYIVKSWQQKFNHKL